MAGFLDRRGFMAAGSASSLALTPGALAAAGDEALADRLAAYRSAVAAAERFARILDEPALRRYRADQAALPHQVTGDRMSTADSRMVATARRWLAEAPDGVEDDETLAECRRLTEAADARDAAREALARRCGVADIVAERQRLADACRTAMDRVVEYPVRRMDELIAKVEAVEAAGDAIPATTLLADLRRIAERAG